MTRLAIIDYGSGNVRSVQRALEAAANQHEIRLDVLLTDDPDRIRHADRIVLPGVGHFKDCRNGLNAVDGMREVLQQQVIGLGRPFLGICVGMQLLFERSEESDTLCLGLLGGEVRRLRPSPGIRIPHMGWNRLNATAAPPHPLVAGLDEASVYFVHSYAAAPSPDTIASSVHGEPFAAVVARGRVMGAQFHPERSSAAGARLLRNFLEIS